MAEYAFRPMTRADYPMFERWLDQPHIDGWWSDSATELRLIDEDMDKGVVDMRIVETGEKPFAFIQDYNAHAFGAPQYRALAADARAIDTFLGDPAFLGHGHGSGYIAQRAGELRQRYPIVLTDPDPANTRAIAAYRRAGFQPDKILPCEDGDPVQVMIYS